MLVEDVCGRRGSGALIHSNQCLAYVDTNKRGKFGYHEQADHEAKLRSDRRHRGGEILLIASVRGPEILGGARLDNRC